MQYKNSQKTSFLMRKAKKKNFHVVMKTFIQKNLLKTYIQPKKMDFFFGLASHAINLEFCLASRKT